MSNNIIRSKGKVQNIGKDTRKQSKQNKLW